MKETKQIIFNVGDEEYGIDILKVKEIEKTCEVIKVPNAPACIVGIMNLRGDVIPVYSLRRRFNIADNYNLNEENQLVIVNIDGTLIGLLVDGVKEILEVTGNNLHKTPGLVLTGDTNFISGVACIDKHIILLIDVDTLINGKDMEEITALIDEMSDDEE